MLCLIKYMWAHIRAARRHVLPACWLLVAVEQLGLERLRELTPAWSETQSPPRRSCQNIAFSICFCFCLYLAPHGHAPAQKMADVGDMDDDFDYDPSDMRRPLGVGEAIASWTNLFNPDMCDFSLSTKCTI